MDNFDRKYEKKKITIFGQNHRLITSFENIFTNNTKWTKKVNLRPKPWINPFEKIQFFAIQHRYFCSLEMLVSYVGQIQRLFYRLFFGEIWIKKNAF